MRRHPWVAMATLRWVPECSPRQALARGNLRSCSPGWAWPPGRGGRSKLGRLESAEQRGQGRTHPAGEGGRLEKLTHAPGRETDQGLRGAAGPGGRTLFPAGAASRRRISHTCPHTRAHVHTHAHPCRRISVCACGEGTGRVGCHAREVTVGLWGQPASWDLGEKRNGGGCQLPGRPPPRGPSCIPGPRSPSLSRGGG